MESRCPGEFGPDAAEWPSGEPQILVNLVHLIRRCSSVSTNTINDGLKAENISFTQLMVLLCLRGRQQVSLTELRHVLGHDSGAMTRLIDSLVEARLVDRVQVGEDRRCIKVGATASGERCVNRAIPIIKHREAEVRAEFSEDELQSFIALLKRLWMALPKEV